MLFISTLYLLATRFFSAISSSSPISLVLSSISSITVFAPIPFILLFLLFLWITSSSGGKGRVSFLYCSTLAKVYAKCAEEEEEDTANSKCVCPLRERMHVCLCGSICVQFPVSVSSICPFSHDVQAPPLMCCPISRWLSYRCIISCCRCLAQDQ